MKPEHAVVVSYSVHPEDGEIYYQPRCRCGWSGNEWYSVRASAAHEGDGHLADRAGMQLW